MILLLILSKSSSFGDSGVNEGGITECLGDSELIRRAKDTASIFDLGNRDNVDFPAPASGGVLQAITLSTGVVEETVVRKKGQDSLVLGAKLTALLLEKCRTLARRGTTNAKETVCNVLHEHKPLRNSIHGTGDHRKKDHTMAVLGSVLVGSISSGCCGKIRCVTTRSRSRNNNAHAVFVLQGMSGNHSMHHVLCSHEGGQW
jgi:hypothetical protein